MHALCILLYGVCSILHVLICNHMQNTLHMQAILQYEYNLLCIHAFVRYINLHAIYMRKYDVSKITHVI